MRWIRSLSYQIMQRQPTREHPLRCKTELNLNCKLRLKLCTKQRLKAEAEEITGFNPRHDFNFLVVSQFGPRKNFENTIKWFVQKFHDKDVGLVLKTSMKGGSRIDFEHTERRLKGISKRFS